MVVEVDVLDLALLGAEHAATTDVATVRVDRDRQGVGRVGDRVDVFVRRKDVTDLKRYLKANIDIFSRCVTRKLLVYATGRSMNFGDERVIDQIVRDVRSSGNGFRDLIIAVVKSESFATK